MIKRIQIENFKSFGKVDLEPHRRVNLLIGPNGSGKSNFLEAVSYLEVNHKYLTRPDKANRKLKSSEWKLKLSFENIFSETIASYINPQLPNEVIHLEGLDINSSGRFVAFFFNEKENNEVNSELTEYEEMQYEGAGIPKDTYAFQVHGGMISSQIKSYRFSQESIGRSVQLSGDFRLISPDCSNLPLMIYKLMNEDDSLYTKICEDLFRLTKEYDLLKSPASRKNKGEIELAVRDFLEQKNYYMDEVSEGISFFIAVLCILHQPNPPKVILLEEPENGIHPRRIIEIYRLILKLAEEKDVQFFITTHSPILLNQFSENPECVWVFDKEEGITKIQNLQNDILEPRRKKLVEMGIEEPSDLTDDLGENWMLGLLDGVPPSILPEDY